MKPPWRRTRLMLSAAAVLGALAGLTMVGGPAYAGGPHISVLSGPREITI
jgi:hypothetical protein